MKSLTLLLAFLASYAQAALALHARTPIEVFDRPLFKSAPIVRTGSHAAQYAGRTTLASGSASQVVSTNAINSDSIINFNLQAAIPASYLTRGQVSIVSGANYGTASTSAIYSGMVVSLALENATAQLSGTAQGLRINSMVDGVSFAITTINSGQLAGNGVAHWSLPTAVPGVRVSSIGVGHFLFATPDGAARPLDQTVMWEIRTSA